MGTTSVGAPAATARVSGTGHAGSEVDDEAGHAGSEADDEAGHAGSEADDAGQAGSENDGAYGWPNGSASVGAPCGTACGREVNGVLGVSPSTADGDAA